MACDLIFAADTAKFGEPEVKLAILPARGAPSACPTPWARPRPRMCLTARMMDAAEAEKAGLVARVIPAERLLEETLAAARTIAGYSLPVVMMIKEFVNRAYESALAEGLQKEDMAVSWRSARRSSATSRS